MNKNSIRDESRFQDPEDVVESSLNFGKIESERLKKVKKILDTYKQRFEKNRFQHLY